MPSKVWISPCLWQDIFSLFWMSFHSVHVVYKNSSLCAASLKNGGPCLVSQCLCEWIVRKEYSPELMLSPSHEGTHHANIVCGDSVISGFPVSEVRGLLDPLTKLIPSALVSRHLLVHCAWHAAYVQDVSLLASRLGIFSVVCDVAGILCRLEVHTPNVRPGNHIRWVWRAARVKKKCYHCWWYRNIWDVVVP